MVYSTLISTESACEHLGDPQWRFIDCRYYLQKPQQGQLEYTDAHLPAALYAHLDDDLSSTVIPGVTGRHPLPDADAVSELFSKWGVDENIQVVVYDQGPGMIAARLWWMFRWLGHDKAAVMDGGWNRWREEAKPHAKQPVSTSPKTFVADVHNNFVASAVDVADSKVKHTGFDF